MLAGGQSDQLDLVVWRDTDFKTFTGGGTVARESFAFGHARDRADGVDRDSAALVSQ